MIASLQIYNSADKIYTLYSSHLFFISLSRRYLFFVAIPPRIWRSLLFVSRILLTSLYRAGLSTLSRWLTSLCTVLLLTPNFLAAFLTVAPFSIMYSPSIAARSSTIPFTRNPPIVLIIYMQRVCCVFILSVVICCFDNMK